MPTLAKDKHCTGCLACHDACRHNGIKIVAKNGHQHVEVDESNCIDCGLCSKVCPVVNPVSKNNPEDIKTYGGWATKEEIRIDAASGGAFTGLAQSFSEIYGNDKVCVIGASLKNNRVYHISVERAEDLYLLMNSKYIQSDTRGIYRIVGNKLRDGYRVMFSGTPCQIAGLYGYLGKRRNDEHLITIELVCHGIASPEALDIHLKHFKSSHIYRFRDKRQGTQDWKFSQCTTIDIDGREKKLARKDDLFYSIYAGWLLDRKSCSDCKFATFGRTADITLADFWGLDVPEYYKQGVSLILANNAKAESLIRKSKCLYTFEASYKIAIKGSPHLYTGFKYIKYHPLVIWPSFFRKILPHSVWVSVVSNKMPWKLLWAFYKKATLLRIERERNKLITAISKSESLNRLLKDVNMGGG